MEGFSIDIESETVRNSLFRRVLYTSAYSQLVLMSIPPGGDIGIEVHGNDQFFRFEEGEGEVVIDGHRHSVKDGSAVVVPAGSEHNVINKSPSRQLKLYTIYSPPHHADGTIHRTKQEALASDEEFDGKTSEGAQGRPKAKRDVLGRLAGRGE